MMSIGTLNDNERKLLEPYSSSVTERLDALRKYSDIGIQTSIFFGPIYPTISIEDIPDVINTFIESGISEIWTDSLNLKPGIWENIRKNLSHNRNMYTVFSERIFENKQYCQAYNS